VRDVLKKEGRSQWDWTQALPVWDQHVFALSSFLARVTLFEILTLR
jgi:hypothetical protein